MKEDAKSRIWLIALLFLGLFFAIVIPVAYAGSTPVDSFTTQQLWLERVTRIILEMVGHENPFVVILLVLGSVVSGVSGFSFLHSAKKVDLYHSIPVKREQLFLAHFLNGALIAGVLYALNLLIGILIAAGFGVGFGVTVKVAFSAYCFHMAFYLLLYATVVVAMMLTGNVIIALLGTTVFFSYGPAVTALLMGYMNVWLSTYSGMSSYGGDLFFENLMKHTSPFGYYMFGLSEYTRTDLFPMILIVILIALVLAALAGWLYHLRPSESAGKAIAFRHAQAPIKILIVVPVTLTFGLFFWSLRTTLGWAIFGLLWGAVFTHCLMEIIYHFDFKKLFAHKVHLIVCLVISLTIFGGFKYDWMGYDSYLPKAESVESAAITMGNRDTWVTYGEVVYDPGEWMDYYWDYSDSTEYALDSMKLTDVADVLTIAQKGIAEVRKSWEDSNYDRPMDTVIIQYTLKNGRKPVRRYRVYTDSVEGEIGRIMNSQEYQKGTYPVLNQKPEETARINFQQFDRVTRVENVDQAVLLTAYQEDFMHLSQETRKRENPIATIQFMTHEMEAAMLYDEVEMKESKQSYSISNIGERAYYPIYPSFVKTLDCLKQAGITVEPGLRRELINQIRVVGVDGKEDDYVYTQRSDGLEGRIYASTEQIEALIPSLIPYDYWHMNGMMEGVTISGLEAVVSLYSEKTGGVQEISCYMDRTKLPDFVK